MEEKTKNPSCIEIRMRVKLSLNAEDFGSRSYHTPRMGFKTRGIPAIPART